MVAEVGEVHHPSDDRGRAGDAPARMVLPVDMPRAGVQGVERAVIGAQVDSGAETGGVGDGGGGIHVGAGLHRPVEFARGGVICVDAPVGVAQEHAAVDDRRGGVERAAAEQGTARAARPQAPAVALANGLQLTRVVAEVEHPAREARARLHGPCRVIGPQHAAGARAERIHGAVLGAEDELAAVQQGGGLAAARQLPCPAEVAVGGVHGHDPSGLRPGRAREDRRVDGVRGHGGGGGRQGAEAPAPHVAARGLVYRVQPGVVAKLVEAVAVHDGRELEQGAAPVGPERLERGAQARGGGEEASVVLGVAVQGPRKAAGALCGQFGRRLRHKRGVGVVDVAGAVLLVEVARQRSAGE